MVKSSIFKIPFFIFFILLANTILGQYPSGFAEDDISNWDTPISMQFDQSGTMYVAERAGKIYKYQNSQKTLLLDITEEVATYGDYGLLGLALDPNFAFNGYMYLYYTVDRHHLLNFGTPSYNVSSSEQGATIARITRYTVSTANNFNNIVLNSRQILLGETKSTGIPLTGIFHAGGDMVFSIDGTLLVSTGDGAYGADYESQALADQIITTEEYNNRRLWRCQMNNSLNGKILRIDPTTGNGLPSNPFFDSNNARSASSRVWAKGFRNPFRFTIKPNTGDHNSNLGQPGVIVVGDVGFETNEEINLVTAAGQNFGWPKFEGINYVYSSNPSFEPINQKMPTVEWNHNVNTAKVVINNTVQNVGSPAFPYGNFMGGCVIAGPFYEGTSYPVEFQNKFFTSDYNAYWIKTFGFENNTNNPISLANFSSSAGSGIVKLTYNPSNESIYFATIFGKICRLKYTSNLNQSPTANIITNRKYGPSPLTIDFDGMASTDPEKETLSYSWAFGDGATGTGAQVSHTFTAATNAPQSFTAILTVTDSFGNTATKSQIISVNNTPPIILSTSIDSLQTYSPSDPISVNLAASVVDAENPNSALTYKWETFLYHNEHVHPEYSVADSLGSFDLEPIACDNNAYFYRVMLTVTDPQGLSTQFTKDIYQKCILNDSIPPQIPQLAVENFDAYSFTLKWNALADNHGIKSIFLNLNNHLIRLLPSQNSYRYVSNYLIANQSFETQLTVVDSAGNSSKSGKMFFKRPTTICPELLYLSDKTPKTAFVAIGTVQKDKSTDGNPITLNGVVFPKGIGVHASSTIEYDLTNEGFTSFTAQVGIDDEINSCGSMVFKVYKDNVLAYSSPTLFANSATQSINLDITNTKILKLGIDPLSDINCDHADWADAKVQSGCVIVDKQAPNFIENFTAIVENDSVKIAWQKPADNLPNALSYTIFLDDFAIYSLSDTSYTFENFENGIHEINIQAMDIFGNISSTKFPIFRCNSSIIEPSLALEYSCDISCIAMHTIKSGDWTDPSIWFCNRIPKATDEVTVTIEHQVIIPNNVTAVVKNLINNGNLIFGESGNLIFNTP